MIQKIPLLFRRATRSQAKSRLKKYDIIESTDVPLYTRDGKEAA